MKKLELPPEYYGFDWELDHRERLSSKKLTEWFHDSVPILKILNWQVDFVRRGECRSTLPLTVEASNQHVAHQAAVIMIAADYTGGVALGSLLDRIPVVGIHPQPDDYGAYLWGAKGAIKWIRPSVDDLLCHARIPAVEHEIIYKRFMSGRRVIIDIPILMYNEDTLVAKAEITYWVQDTNALRRNAIDASRIHALFDFRTKASARLIAGLRASEQRRPLNERRFQDESSLTIAGKQGILLADRFLLLAPQLQEMISARTQNADEFLAKFHSGRAIQVVNIGSGFDNRNARVHLPPGSTVFNLDLPSMLVARQSVIVEPPDITTVAMPIDLREQSVWCAVKGCADYDDRRPTAVIWEGGSMYFDASCSNKILRDSKRLLENNDDSRLWIDYVRPSVFDGTSELTAVNKFSDGMRRMGEPFVNGYEDIVSHLMPFGLCVIDDMASNICHAPDDEIYNMYRFATISGNRGN